MDALHRFRTLARDFHQAARIGDAEGMEAILTERREILGTLAGGDEGDPERRAALQEILDLDRESESVLERRRSEIRDELATLGRGKRGLRGYGAGAARPSKWIDERG